MFVYSYRSRYVSPLTILFHEHNISVFGHATWIINYLVRVTIRSMNKQLIFVFLHPYGLLKIAQCTRKIVHVKYNKIIKLSAENNSIRGI